MTTTECSEQTFKCLRLLAQQFPNEQSAFIEIINLQAILIFASLTRIACVTFTAAQSNNEAIAIVINHATNGRK
ncbi:hypothetical protein ACTNA2_08675 [Collinsella sp. HCP28S3_E9]|uniref:hypothetical protein n=1 Tax=Collinsella sp. HCP28S3_E9 TaxID=3438924 RepID=UPI003F89D1D6